MAHGGSAAPKDNRPPGQTFGRWWRGEQQGVMSEGSPRLDSWSRTREGSPADIAETVADYTVLPYMSEAEGSPLGKAAKMAKALRAPSSAAFKGDPLEFLRPKLRTEYPETLPGVLTTDPKSGKEYLAKQLSPEAEVVGTARKKAQKAIDKGEYTPFFDVTQRAHVDPANYPLPGNTLTDALPKKEATIQKYREQFDTPGTRARLSAAYLRGAEDPMTKDWYAMKQLEDQYVAELGPEQGRAAFKQLWDSMAATTGGSDPTSNLLMAHFGNYMKEKGMRAPEAAHEMPFPIGGRYASGNMEMYNKVLGEGGAPLSAELHPKRHNFAANFLGHRDKATIDEQMMTGFDPTGTLKAPPGMSYGVTEDIVGQLAREHGVMPQNFQDVTWAGLKGTTGKPMMQHVNEALERTSRITGQTPEEVLRANLIRKQGPLFGIGAGGVALEDQGEFQ